jgi:hypothetical protein
VYFFSLRYRLCRSVCTAFEQIQGNPRQPSADHLLCRVGRRNSPNIHAQNPRSAGNCQRYLTVEMLQRASPAGSGEKFEPISTNPYLSIINRLFDEINQLFLEFLLEIENFIENRSDISLKFFISTGFFQNSTGYLITKPRFSPDIGPLGLLGCCICTFVSSFNAVSHGSLVPKKRKEKEMLQSISWILHQNA